MPDDFDAPDDDAPDDSNPMKELRQQAKEAKAAQQHAAELEAKLAERDRFDAFRDAGLDPKNDKVHKAIVDGYKGDVDKVSEYVADLGLVAPVTPPVEVPQQEQQAMQRVQAAQAGGDMPTPPPSQNDEMVEFFNRIPDNGKKEEALAAWLAERGEPVGDMGPQSDLFPMR